MGKMRIWLFRVCAEVDASRGFRQQYKLVKAGSTHLLVSIGVSCNDIILCVSDNIFWIYAVPYRNSEYLQNKSLIGMCELCRCLCLRETIFGTLNVVHPANSAIERMIICRFVLSNKTSLTITVPYINSCFLRKPYNEEPNQSTDILFRSSFSLNGPSSALIAGGGASTWKYSSIQLNVSLRWLN